jgi:hypothetical protein
VLRAENQALRLRAAQMDELEESVETMTRRVAATERLEAELEAARVEAEASFGAASR